MYMGGMWENSKSRELNALAVILWYIYIYMHILIIVLHIKQVQIFLHKDTN